MSSFLLKMLGKKVEGSASTYADDVFKSHTFDGNSSTQTLTTGINLQVNGGAVILKPRTGTLAGPAILDTVRGVGKRLRLDLTDAELNAGNVVTAFGTTGVTVDNTSWNITGDTDFAMSFRRSGKFFDIVTFTAATSTNQRVAHSLGGLPGMIWVKRTDAVGPWYVYHTAIGITGYLDLSTTAITVTPGASPWGTAATTTTDFGVNVGSLLVNGGTYVAYVFGHNTAADGLIQCGSFNGAPGTQVLLNWEPQCIMWKNTTAVGGWRISDVNRGNPVSGASNYVELNTTAVEASTSALNPYTSGFVCNLSLSGNTIIYMAIRKPNKPAVLGTDVFNVIARTGTAATATVTGVGFAPDAVIGSARTDKASGPNVELIDKAHGLGKGISLNGSGTELLPAAPPVTAFTMDGVKLSADNNGSGAFNFSATGYIEWFFKRAPNFFDIVYYTGSGTNQNIANNLTSNPVFMIVKAITNAGSSPYVYHISQTGTKEARTDGNSPFFSSINFWNDTTPIAGVVTVGTSLSQASTTYLMYMWCALAGVSSAGAYTGNGSSQTINCGFTAGARFILIKRTDTTGDWYIWDTARGVIAGNDPHLSLNGGLAEVTTDDTIDPDTSGFIVNQVAATNVNVTAAAYIYFAIA